MASTYEGNYNPGVFNSGLKYKVGDISPDFANSGDVITYNGTDVVWGSGAFGGVTSLDGLTGAVTLSAGSGIILTPTGNDIEISSSGIASLTDPLEVWYTNAGGTAPASDAEFTRNPATGEFTAQRTSAAFETEGFYLIDMGGTVPSALMEASTATTRANVFVDDTGLVTAKAEALGTGAYSQMTLGNIVQLTSDSNVGLSASFQVSQNALFGGNSTDGTNTAIATFAAQSLNTISFTNGVATSSITQDASSTIMGFTDGASFNNNFISGVDGASITEYSLFTSAGLTLLDYQSSATVENAYLFSNLPVAPTTATDNIFIGSSATGLTTGSNITALGWGAAGSVTTAEQITAIGYNAANSYTVISPALAETLVTAVGFNALAAATEYRNTAVGARAAQSLTGNQGYANVFVGDEAGKSMTSGYHNVIIGGEAVKTSTGVSDSVHIGYGASVVSTGNSNTGVGANSLYANTSGSNNIGIGISSGFSAAQEGDNNIFIGYETDVTNTTDSNNFVVGRVAQAVGNDTIVFGSEDFPYFHGYVGQGRFAGTPGAVSDVGFILHGTAGGYTGGGMSDGPGRSLKIAGGSSTGVGKPADTGFMTSMKGPTADPSDENPVGDRYTVIGDLVQIADNTDTPVVNIAVADPSTNGASVGGTIWYTIRAKDGAGAIETHHNHADFIIENVGGTINPVITVYATPVETGTWTVTTTLVDDGVGGANVSIQADNSLNEPNLVSCQVLINFGEATVTSL